MTDTNISKKSFLLYRDTYDAIKNLKKEEKGDLLDALYLYSSGKKLPEMSPMANLAFSFMKRSLDQDTERYIAKCETNRENGKLGGRPKKPKKSERLLSKANGYFENPKNLNNNSNSNNNNIKRNNKEKISYKQKNAVGENLALKELEEFSLSFDRDSVLKALGRSESGKGGSK